MVSYGKTATYHIELLIFLEHIYLRHLHFGETFFYEINIFLWNKKICNQIFSHLKCF
jgi:hypothetical protein